MDLFKVIRGLIYGGLVLGGGGCAERQVRRDPPAPPAGLAKKDTAYLPPPAPAPALFIPGPTPPAMARPVETPPTKPDLMPPPATPTPARYIPPVHPVPPKVSQVPPADCPPLAPSPLPKFPSTGTEPATLPPLVVQATDAGPIVPQAAPVSPLRALHRKAVERYAQIDTYVMRLRRREVIGNVHKPEEVILCKFRQEPFSVYLKWLGAEAKGREVMYVKGRHDNKVHTLLAAGDVPLVPAGKHMTFAVDSLLVKSNSRYAITEAGLGNLITRFGQAVERTEKGDMRWGTLHYLGLVKRPEFETKLEAVLHTIPPRADPLLPGGGKRLVFFEPHLQLPVLVVTQDENNREVEYYCHDRFQIPGGLEERDFDPDPWSKPTPKGKAP